MVARRVMEAMREVVDPGRWPVAPVALEVSQLSVLVERHQQSLPVGSLDLAPVLLHLHMRNY
jgi:hypothetical protein